MYYSSSLLYVGVFLVISTGANTIPENVDANTISENVDSSRIVGGAPVPGGAFFNAPYTVSVQLRNQQGQPTRGHHCGGALIANNRVLTVASCVISPINLTHFEVSNPNTLRIFVGSVFLAQDTSARVRNVVDITVHPLFHHVTFINDLALLRTNTPFNFVANEIAGISLRTVPMFEHTACYLTGWGGDELATISPQMHVLGANVHNHFECGEVYNQTRPVGYGSVCASSLPGAAPCWFDIGGPLVCDGVLSGLLSYGMHCNQFPGAPSVYVRIEVYTPWINNVLASSSLVSGQTSFLLLFSAIFFQLFQNLKKFE